MDKVATSPISDMDVDMASDVDNDNDVASDMDDDVAGDMDNDASFSAHLLKSPFWNCATILGHFLAQCSKLIYTTY